MLRLTFAILSCLNCASKISNEVNDFCKSSFEHYGDLGDSPYEHYGDLGDSPTLCLPFMTMLNHLEVACETRYGGNYLQTYVLYVM